MWLSGVSLCCLPLSNALGKPAQKPRASAEERSPERKPATERQRRAQAKKAEPGTRPPPPAVAHRGRAPARSQKETRQADAGRQSASQADKSARAASADTRQLVEMVESSRQLAQQVRAAQAKKLEELAAQLQKGADEKAREEIRAMAEAVAKDTRLSKQERREQVQALHGELARQVLARLDAESSLEAERAALIRAQQQRLAELQEAAKSKRAQVDAGETVTIEEPQQAGVVSAAAATGQVLQTKLTTIGAAQSMDEAIDRLSKQSAELQNSAELNMLRLQQLMAQRSISIQLVSSMLRSLKETQAEVIRNIR